MHIYCTYTHKRFFLLWISNVNTMVHQSHSFFSFIQSTMVIFWICTAAFCFVLLFPEKKCINKKRTMILLSATINVLLL